MKKLLGILLMVCLLASMLSAVAFAEEASGDVEIWYYWETEGHQKALNHIIEEFNASQDAITVSAKYVPFADFKKQLSIGAAADALPDLVILDNPDHAAYAAMGVFADITDKFDVSTYYPGPVNSCTLDGKLYGVPFGSNDLVLFYNEDMLAAAGCEVPTTWDELLEVAKACSNDKVSGFAHCSLPNEEGTFNFLTWVWSTGATAYEMNSEGGIKALTQVKKMVDEGAMRSEVPDLKWNVAPIPQDKVQASGLGGENYAVIAGGNEAAAIEFLKYATSKDVCLYMMNAMGYISSDSTIAEGQFEGDPIYQVFVDEMQYANARGPLPTWPQISDAISLAFNEVMTGSDPAEAAAKAQATIDSILG